MVVGNSSGCVSSILHEKVSNLKFVMWVILLCCLALRNIYMQY